VPRTLRHTLEAAFGLSVAALPVAVPATAALAGDHPPSPTWTPPSLDRPVAQSAPPPTAQPSPPRWYVVRPGDCLWTIARAHLPGSRSNAAVAAAWPTWYAANRHAIGPDPDLIRVGLHLHEPRGLEVAP
jgi:nucleoid-associated protein YgaU